MQNQKSMHVLTFKLAFQLHSIWLAIYMDLVALWHAWVAGSNHWHAFRSELVQSPCNESQPISSLCRLMIKPIASWTQVTRTCIDLQHWLSTPHSSVQHHIHRLHVTYLSCNKPIVFRPLAKAPATSSSVPNFRTDATLPYFLCLDNINKIIKYQTLDIEFLVIWLALYSQQKSYIL